MPPPRSEIYERALGLLNDGDWHDYNEIVRKCAILVPPGIAVRTTESERLRWVRRSGVPAEEQHLVKRSRPLTRSREIEVGARIVVTRVLKNRRRFEIDPRGVRSADADKRIRMKKLD